MFREAGALRAFLDHMLCVSIVELWSERQGENGGKGKCPWHSMDAGADRPGTRAVDGLGPAGSLASATPERHDAEQVYHGSFHVGPHWRGNGRSTSPRKSCPS